MFNEIMKFMKRDSVDSNHSSADIEFTVETISFNQRPNIVSPLKPKSNKKSKHLKKKLIHFLRNEYHLLAIIVISVIGFGFHISDAVKQYWEYNTKVSFNAEEPHNYKYRYPGITICYKDLVQYSKLRQKYAEFGEDVDRIKAQMEFRNDSNFFAHEDSANLTTANTSGNLLQQYYEEKLISETSILDILELWSFGAPNNCELYSHPISNNSVENCEDISNFIESINSDVRCFTYFSQFNIANKNLELFTTSMFRTTDNYEHRENRIAYFGFDRFESNPFESYFRARVAVHPPNMIPDPEYYPTLVLYEWRFYAIIFWKTVSYLLPPPYKTNCIEYDIRNSNTLQSYDDCLAKCIIRSYRQKCNCLPRIGLLYRKHYLNNDDMFCPLNNTCKSQNIRSQCANACQPDCVSEQYQFETMADIPWFNFKNYTGIRINRKPVLDQVYRHSPEITWIQLVSDFGGLGGMWLGISVIHVSKAIIYWFNRSRKNRTQIEGENAKQLISNVT